MSEQRAVSVRVEYTPTFRDYLWLTITVVWRRLQVVAIFAALSLLASLCVGLKVSAAGEGDLAGYAYLLFYLFFFPAIVFVILPVYVFVSARRQWQTVETLRESKAYEFSDSGIVVESRSASGRATWDNVARADLIRGSIILTYTQPIYLFLPTSAFPDQGVLDAFLDLLRAKVPDCRGF
jgi:hypothetical protein